MIDHLRETTPGLIGNCTAGAAWGIAWLTADGLPILHALSMVAGILLSIITGAYYFAKWRLARSERKRRALRRGKCKR